MSSPLAIHSEFLGHYHQYKDKLFAYFFFRLGDRGLAEDLVQETVLRAYEAYDRYDSRFAFSTWIYTIARNAYIDVLRRHRPTDPLPEENEGGPVEDGWQEMSETLDVAIDTRRVLDAVAHLPSKQSDSIRLRLVDELSDKDIAKRLGLSPEAVRQNISRGLRSLRSLLLCLLFYFFHV